MDVCRCRLQIPRIAASQLELAVQRPVIDVVKPNPVTFGAHQPATIVLGVGDELATEAVILNTPVSLEAPEHAALDFEPPIGIIVLALPVTQALAFNRITDDGVLDPAL